jgi:hypothetical protein
VAEVVGRVLVQHLEGVDDVVVGQHPRLDLGLADAAVLELHVTAVAARPGA